MANIRLRLQRTRFKLTFPSSICGQQMAAAQRAPTIAMVRDIWRKIERVVSMSEGDRALLACVIAKEANNV